MRGDVVMEFQAILAVSNYETFLKRVSCYMSPAELSCRLRRAVKCSVMYWRESVKGRYKGVIDSWASNCSANCRSNTLSGSTWETTLKEMAQLDFAAEKNRRRSLLQPLITFGKRNSATKNSSAAPTRQFATSTTDKWERGAKPADNNRTRSYANVGTGYRGNSGNGGGREGSKYAGAERKR